MLIEIKQGMVVPVAGAPQQEIFPGKDPQRVALLGLDHVDLRASLQVEEGQRVQAGQTLFTDRADPRVRFAAPGSGRVVEINRGPRRSLLSIVIEREGDETAGPLAVPDARPSQLSRDDVCGTLLEAGMWPSLRARPYGRMAGASNLPSALFVTAMDTNPLAADPAIVIADRVDDFVNGLAVVSRLAPATWLCTAPGVDLPRPEVAGLTQVEFAGRHPAGLVGTHVRHLQPEGGEVWHIGYQDVIAVGHLFRTGVPSRERVIALAGPGVRKPRLIRTRTGADLAALLDSDVVAGSRVVFGSPLTGRTITPASAYLGRYDDQVSVLQGQAPVPANAGPAGAMLPMEDFDRVWPFAAPVGPLLRALLIRDTETANALGCLALVEEDMALCSYVCPANLDYASALRATLREIEAGR